MDVALFSPSSLFGGDDDDDDTNNASGLVCHGENESIVTYVERTHVFPKMKIHIREFSFHELNANLLWPGSLSFAEWLVQHESYLKGRRILELGRKHAKDSSKRGTHWNCRRDRFTGLTIAQPQSDPGIICNVNIVSKKIFEIKFPCERWLYFDLPKYPRCKDEISSTFKRLFPYSGTGALAIFVSKLLQVDITTSDFDDLNIEDNIAHNCQINGVPQLPHIRHSWGDRFPCENPEWDLILASDILLYVKQYQNLIKTLSFLLKAYKPKGDKASGSELKLPQPSFLMSWKRRIGKADESLFFAGCEACGLKIEHLGSRIYCITP